MVGQGEYFVEALPADANSQYALLVVLGGPPRSIHHPQEVRLHPAHPSQAHSSLEALLVMVVLVLDHCLCDMGLEGLVDD